jgi:hypothetical protein
MISQYLSEYEIFFNYCKTLYATPYVWHRRLRRFVTIASPVYRRRFMALSFLGRLQLLVMLIATTLAASGSRESLVNVVLSIGLTLFYFMITSMRSMHSQREKAEDVVFLFNSILRCEQRFTASRGGNLTINVFS